jgi:beta-galactosidase
VRLPEDSYYYYQAWWGDKPVVHILPHWNWAGKEGQIIRVWAYGNGEKIELFLNNKSIGTRTCRATDTLSGKPVCRRDTGSAGVHERQNRRRGQSRDHGRACRSRLKTDRIKLTADGEDITMVEVDVIDSKGASCPPPTIRSPSP